MAPKLWIAKFGLVGRRIVCGSRGSVGEDRKSEIWPGSGRITGWPNFLSFGRMSECVYVSGLGKSVR